MTVVCVVQARMGSTRLPGKVLADLGGRTMLTLVLRRLTPAPVDRLVVATTEDPADEAVVTAALAEGADVVRGSAHDVLARFVAVLDRHPADAVVRITADCPFIDPGLVGAVVARWRDSAADYASNTLDRTYPDGLDVEVVSSGALRAAATESTDPYEREHVTPFVYRRPERFRLAGLRHHDDRSHHRWTVDTAEDLDRVRRLLARVGRIDFGWEDLLPLDQRPASTDVT